MITLGELDYDEALRYMGVKKGKADANTLAMLPQCEQLVIKNSIPRYRYGIFDIEKTDKGIQVINTNLLLTGKDIERHLNGCYGIVLMCATLSGNIDNLIRTAQLQDMSKAIVIILHLTPPAIKHGVTARATAIYLLTYKRKF